ncbi:hypothetical protein P3S67_016668 [Capsicum chacoense]
MLRPENFSRATWKLLSKDIHCEKRILWTYPVRRLQPVNFNPFFFQKWFQVRAAVLICKEFDNQKQSYHSRWRLCPIPKLK